MGLLQTHAVCRFFLSSEEAYSGTNNSSSGSSDVSNSTAAAAGPLIVTELVRATSDVLQELREY